MQRTAQSPTLEERKTSSAPTVSVLMTVYNGMPYLVDAVESILHQDFDDFEFIVVNDGSTDDSAAYLDGLQDHRLTVFHRENRGTSAASNFGLKHCRGEFVARMDADDVSVARRLSTQVNFLRQNPDVGLVGSHARVIGSRSTGMKVDLPTEHDAIRTSLLNIDHGIAHGSCMFRRSLIERLGGYWDLRSYDDWDMFIRMGEISRLANIDDVLYYYRHLTTGLVGSGLRKARRHYAFSAELAKRRADERPPIEFEEFSEMLDSAPLHQRLGESVGNFALHQYRIANAEMCGGRRFTGMARLALAATCSPRRTLVRLGRFLGRGTRR